MTRQTPQGRQNAVGTWLGLPAPDGHVQKVHMRALSLQIRPTESGWGVYLSNGQELTRYHGLWAKTLALRYLQRYTQSAGDRDADGAAEARLGAVCSAIRKRAARSALAAGPVLRACRLRSWSPVPRTCPAR